MHEKELRLAVVLTGGVSLAVFMHGVSRELLKLVRASRVYHGVKDRPDDALFSYHDVNDDPHRETDTEAVYFQLLQVMSQTTKLRVIIDVISGASAGGVNGVMLARALAHDLPLDAHRAMWLEHADAIDLMDERTSARAWSKLYLQPIISALFRTRLAALAPDQETRDKLRRFLRSRWFKPPFSGKRFAGWMLDACEAMSEGRHESGSLMPDGHPLDLFVSVTDFYGHNRVVRLYDPPQIVEPEHRHILHFHYERSPEGVVVSDFDSGMVPALVFSARATASFPGAFPPATIAEMDEVLKKRGSEWPRRSEFLRTKFRALLKGGRDPEETVFIDGSTVNNKPFAAAISALTGRPAHREVVRRVLYVDPDPDPDERRNAIHRKVPGMFRTIVGAAIEIPGNEPVRDELERLDDVNRRIRTLRKVIELARPAVDQQVDAIIAQGQACMAPDAATIAVWRRQANAKAATDSGFSFESYFQLKLLRVLERLETLFTDLAARFGVDDNGETARSALLAWGQHNLGPLAGPQAQIDRTMDIAFLRGFDVDFRVRRIRFVIRRLNQLYRHGSGEADAIRAGELDEIKTALYRELDLVKRRWSADFFAPDTARIAAGLVQSAGDAHMARLIHAAEFEMDLVGADSEIDTIFQFEGKDNIGLRARRELLGAYVGFGFFDVLVYPMVQWEDIDELEEIHIHRLSPQDAKDIRSDGEPVTLKGAELRHFGAFFNRSYREHDYLWGRLTTADRLVDIVADAVPEAAHHIDMATIKHRLFEAILEAEIPYLKTDKTLIPGLRDILP